MNAVFRFHTVIPLLLLTVTVHAGLEQEKTKCFCDGSGEVYRIAVVAVLRDGRGSVGLVNPDGQMTVLNEGEAKLGCRLVEVAVMQTSTLAVLDCGQGEVPYRVGEELRTVPVIQPRLGTAHACGAATDQRRPAELETAR